MGKRGFKRTRPLYALKFEPPQDGSEDEYAGLEIMARAIPLRDFFELQQLQRAAETDPDAQKKIITGLAGVIVSWNLLDDDDKAVPVAYAICRDSGKPGEPGQPCTAHQGAEIPCEYTGLCEYDLPFVLTIFYTWMTAVASIPNLLRGTSNDGGTSQELSIPMEAP